MKRLLLPLLAALALPSIAGDLGPADLLQEQMSNAFPKVGTTWEGFCGTFEKGQDGNVKFFNNTVLVEYINKNGKDGLALFSFRENQISQWYGFANAMRMISKGARPELPKTNLD